MASSKRSKAQKNLYTVIFEAETPAGKLFDILLILCIKLSVLVVMLDSVKAVRLRHGGILAGLEWFFTILFTIEYLLRLYCSPEKKKYVLSFFGTVDLLSVLPTYFSLFYPGGKYLLVIRILRVLRVFRVLKLVKFLREAEYLLQALKASRRKIFVFLYAVVSLVVILGSLMYVIESEQSGFTSIPRSVYWAIVTLTTVGYGDISPLTATGQSLAAVIMILGYSIIAVPTGIVTVELGKLRPAGTKTSCASCGTAAHEEDAFFCRRCGMKLNKTPQPGEPQK